MDISKLFRSYKRKLLWEGILKSFVFALMACGVTVFVTSLVYHILTKKTPVLLTAWIALAVFAAVFALLFGVFYYPTKKRVASRMDEMGLQERVGTMLAFRNETGFMVQLQREDAVLHIEKSSPKQLKLRSFMREGIACAVCVCLAFAMLMLPYDIFKITAEKEIVMDENQSQIIQDLIENLREEVNNSLLDEELKEEINDIIDDLEEDLNNTDSELEQAGKIEDAKEQIKDLLEKALTRKSIGKELQKYQLTKQLGVAVSDGNLEGVSKAMSALKALLQDNTDLVEDLYRIIDRALTDSEVSETDALYRAFDDFSQGLKNLNVKASSYSKDLTAVFDTAEAAILKALEKQEIIESEKDKMEDILEDAKEDILDNKDGEKEEEEGEEGEGEKGEGEEGKGEEGEGKGEDGEGDQPGSGKPGGDKPGGEGDGEEGKDDAIGGGDGSREDDMSSMTEGIYDPYAGSVSYGKVFAAYYADYLAARKEGKIPEAMQKILDAYFAALTDTKE